MKKVLFLAVLLSFCGLAFGQHFDYVDQWGNLNTSTVTQDVDNPYDYVGNTAYVYQYGDENISEVLQYNESAWLAGNNAEVFQSGNVNDAFIDQQVAGNDAEIDQYGDENDASTTQIGEFNNSGTLQEGYYNMSTVNIFGFYNVTYNWQTGWGNVSVQTMGDADAIASVGFSEFYSDQWGDYNYAEQIVFGDGDLMLTYHFDNYGAVYQYGDLNEAINWINGSWNTSYQYQMNDYNYSFHWQDGDGNLSVTYQNW